MIQAEKKEKNSLFIPLFPAALPIIPEIAHSGPHKKDQREFGKEIPKSTGEPDNDETEGEDRRAPRHLRRPRDGAQRVQDQMEVHAGGGAREVVLQLPPLHHPHYWRFDDDDGEASFVVMETCQCRKNPPTGNGFPTIRADDWCGSFDRSDNCW